MPGEAFATSCSPIPERWPYDVATALVLWPAFVIIAHDATHFLKRLLEPHKRRFIIWGLAVPYLLFALYALFAQIPDKSLHAYIVAVISLPPLVIAAPFFYQALKYLYTAHPRRYVSGIITLPYVIVGGYFVFTLPAFPILWTVLAYLAIYFGTSKIHAMEVVWPWKRRVFLHFAIILMLMPLVYASRPTCCPARHISELTYSCGCLCYKKASLTIGPEEKALEQKALNGDIAAQCKIGWFYLRNSYTMEEHNKGLEWLRKAGKSCDKPAK